MKHYMIRMNKEDLKGNVESPLDCPLCRATKRRFEDADYVSCGVDTMTIQRLGAPIGERWKTYRVSKTGVDFQRDLFDGRKREPITFVIREDQ